MLSARKQTHCPGNPDSPQTLVPGSAFLSSGQRGTLWRLWGWWLGSSSSEHAAMSKPTKGPQYLLCSLLLKRVA